MIFPRDVVVDNKTENFLTDTGVYVFATDADTRVKSCIFYLTLDVRPSADEEELCFLATTSFLSNQFVT